MYLEWLFKIWIFEVYFIWAILEPNWNQIIYKKFTTLKINIGHLIWLNRGYSNVVFLCLRLQAPVKRGNVERLLEVAEFCISDDEQLLRTFTNAESSYIFGHNDLTKVPPGGELYNTASLLASREGWFRLKLHWLLSTIAQVAPLFISLRAMLKVLVKVIWWLAKKFLLLIDRP